MTTGVSTNEEPQNLTDDEAAAVFATIPLRFLALRRARKFAGIGLVCGVIGWIIEWAFGSLIAFPGVAASKGLPSFAGVLFVVLATGLFGAGYGSLITIVGRRMADGRTQIASQKTPSSSVRAVWWARWIAVAIIASCTIIAMGSVFFLGQWALLGQAWLNKISWSEIPQVFLGAVVAGIVFATSMILGELAEWVLQRLMPWIMPSRARRLVLACVGGLMTAGVFFGVLVGAAYLADPFFIAAGIGPTFTFATLASALPLAVWASVGIEKEAWDEAKPVRDTEPETTTKSWWPSSQDDFRNWNLDAETSVGGEATNGYPYYLWREGADNRLGLSRPRYCCITERDDGLYFTFFNPSEKIRATGGLAVFCGVAALVAIAMFATYLFETRPALPYHLDRTPPPFLVLIGTLFSALIMGAIISGAWYVLITLLRWYRGRFEGDGHLYMMPLRSLLSFNEVHAGEAGALVNGEKAKTGHALTAAFEDGSMWILTGNAWDFPSIVAKHRNLTNAFREPRDKYLAEWDARRKEAARKAEAPAGAALAERPRSAQGIPDRL